MRYSLFVYHDTKPLITAQEISEETKDQLKAALFEWDKYAQKPPPANDWVVNATIKGSPQLTIHILQKEIT